MRLRTRVALLVALCLAAATSLAGLGAYTSTRSQLETQTDDFLNDRIARYLGPERDAFSRGAVRGLPPRGGISPNKVVRELVGGLPIVEPDAIVQVVDASGGLVLGVRDAMVLEPTEETLARARRSGRAVFDDVDVGGIDFRALTAPLTADTFVQVARSTASTEEALAVLRGRLLTIAAGVTLAGAVVGWIGARLLTRPIERLATTAEHVAKTQELDTRIEVGGAGEVGRLAVSMDAMLAALAASRRQQHDLVLDAGHELRTPLTTLRTSVELLKRPDLTAAHRAQLSAQIDEELMELTNMVSELVDLGTDNHADDKVTDVDVGEMVDRVAQRARRRYRRSVAVVGDAGIVRVRPAVTERAITNLVDNASKFAPEQTAIEIRLFGDRIEVHDGGPGIAAEDRPKVFDRFHRSPAARAAPGSGLGLAIVAQAAELNGGKPIIGESDLGGAMVGFTFG